MPGKNPASAAPSKKRRSKAARGGHKNHRRRNDSPHHHDHGNPLARAEAGQRQIARHLEKEISGEEDSRAQTVNFIAESQLSLIWRAANPTLIRSR